MKKHQRRLLWLVLSCMTFGSLWACVGFGQEGRPITARDLSGMTICYSDGHKVYYYPGGRMVSDMGAHFVWSVPEPGILHLRRTIFTAEVLPDRQIHLYQRIATLTGNQLDIYGRHCHWNQ